MVVPMMKLAKTKDSIFLQFLCNTFLINRCIKIHTSVRNKLAVAVPQETQSIPDWLSLFPHCAVSCLHARELLNSTNHTID